MTTVENIIENITNDTALGQAQRAILESLALTARRTEELFKIELMNKIDNDAGEKIPVKKLVNLNSIIGVHIKETLFKDLHQTIEVYMNPFLEDTSCLVAKIIPRLFAYSLQLNFSESNDICKTISRRYVYTDRTAIYKLELSICSYKIPCPSLLPSIDSVYCIVGSKATVDVKRIDFPCLVHFYQRQLTAHGIDDKALDYLFQEFKSTYYKLLNPGNSFFN